MTDPTPPVPGVKILSRADLLSGDHLKRELVPVPDLGGSIWMRELGSGQILIFNGRIQDWRAEGKTEVSADMSVQLMALIVSLSACDETGALIFTEADVQGLLVNKIDVLRFLADQAMELSGLDKKFDGEASSEVTANLKNDLMTSSS